MLTLAFLVIIINYARHWRFHRVPFTIQISWRARLIRSVRAWFRFTWAWQWWLSILLAFCPWKLFLLEDLSIPIRQTNVQMMLKNFQQSVCDDDLATDNPAPAIHSTRLPVLLDIRAKHSEFNFKFDASPVDFWTLEIMWTSKTFCYDQLHNWCCYFANSTRSIGLNLDICSCSGAFWRNYRQQSSKWSIRIANSWRGEFFFWGCDFAGKFKTCFWLKIPVSLLKFFS